VDYALANSKYEKEKKMKKLFLILLIVLISGCSTIGGATSGLGKDIQKLGELIDE